MISEQILKVLVFSLGRKKRWGLPGYVEDLPGIGKTSMIEQFAESWGLPCFVLSPGEQGEGAFGVVPVHANGKLTYPKPDWVDHYFGDGVGILFIDEATLADPLLQKPMHGLVNERRIGSTYLGDGVRVLLAGNPVEIAAGGWETAPALANRYGHFRGNGASMIKWTNWVVSGIDEGVEQKNYLDEERRVRATWPQPWAKVTGTTVAFIRANPDMLMAMPKVADPKASKAWPSPRTWELGMRAMAGCEVHGCDDSTTMTVLAAFVGQGAATQFLTFMNELDLPDPRDVLEGKVAWKHDKSRLDRTVAVINACAKTVLDPSIKDLAAQKGKPEKVLREEYAKALWTMINGVQKSAPSDIIVPAASALTKARLMLMEEADPVMVELQPVLAAAQLTPKARAGR